MTQAETNILSKICNDKRLHVAERKSALSLANVKARIADVSAPRGFIKALKTSVAAGHYGLICEIKKASPSKGLIRPDFNPTELAKTYEAAGATCLSVLTDVPYFMGADTYLSDVRDVTSLPLLRKDFMVDAYQIYEARMLGADCILLIMAALTDAEAIEFEDIAHSLGMDVLVEVHDETELKRALANLKSPLIGINNRNLKTMSVSIDTTLQLARSFAGHERLWVSESGLAQPSDLTKCAEAGARCFLIGETFMRADDIAAAVKAFQV